MIGIWFLVPDQSTHDLQHLICNIVIDQIVVLSFGTLLQIILSKLRVVCGKGSGCKVQEFPWDSWAIFGTRGFSVDRFPALIF